MMYHSYNFIPFVCISVAISAQMSLTYHCVPIYHQFLFVCVTIQLNVYYLYVKV